MEWIASLEAGPQEFTSLCFCNCGINRRPFRRKLATPVEAPIGIVLGNRLANLFRTQVFEQSLANDLADFRLIVCDEVFGNTPDDLVYLLLPLHVVVRHL